MLDERRGDVIPDAREVDSGSFFCDVTALRTAFWGVAKLVRHLTLDQGIGGSSPPSPAKLSSFNTALA